MISNSYECSQTECTYSVTVKNTDDFTRKGFVRVNAFITVHYGDATTRQQVGTDRVEFSVSKGEQKIISGKFHVVKKPKNVNFSAGQVGESI